MRAPRGVCVERNELARNDGGKCPRRAAICGGAFLLASLLWVQIVLADENLLRGPRKAVRATAQAAEPAAGKQGIGEDIAAAPVRFYQRFLAPHWGRRCSYYPSCSNYALLAIRKHGALVGSIMTFDRLQHESNEARYSPLIRTGSEIRVYDPLENNDYWWYIAIRSEPAAPAGAEIEQKPY
ncbi:MAG: membrane protein insertion efficiency factor YidD [Proteobacteria bacterium]|nr:membrane protein insertion efficiency factor YidD [Pseudomonadota bacterium]